MKKQYSIHGFVILENTELTKKQTKNVQKYYMTHFISNDKFQFVGGLI